MSPRRGEVENRTSLTFLQIALFLGRECNGANTKEAGYKNDITRGNQPDFARFRRDAMT